MGSGSGRDESSAASINGNGGDDAVVGLVPGGDGDSDRLAGRGGSDHRQALPVEPSAATTLWVEVTLRLPQDEFVHPDIVRDDLLEALDSVSWSNVEQATVTDTSHGYMEAAP